MAKSNGTSSTGTAGMEGAGPAAMKEGIDRVMSLAGEAGEIGRGNIEAFMESAKIAGKGAEEINTRAFGYMQSSMENGMEAARAITSAKTVQEAMELQAEFAKSAFERYVSEFSAMTSMMTSTIRESLEPLHSRTGEVVEKLQAST